MKYNYKEVAEFLEQPRATHQDAQKHFNISKATWYRWADKHRANKDAGVDDLKLQLQTLREELSQVRSEHSAMVDLIVELGVQMDGETLRAYQVPRAAVQHREDQRQKFLESMGIGSTS